MPQSKIKATFMRGGTSKAVVFNRQDLPADPAHWDPIFLSVMGSPDPNGRQLDGMGGGLSSLSKVCVVGPPTRPDADIDYTFGQVSVKGASVDYSGNCGNMSSAMGPFAVTEGLVKAPANGEAVVRIHNTNTTPPQTTQKHKKREGAGWERREGVVGGGGRRWEEKG